MLVIAHATVTPRAAEQSQPRSQTSICSRRAPQPPQLHPQQPPNPAFGLGQLGQSGQPRVMTPCATAISSAMVLRTAAVLVQLTGTILKLETNLPAIPPPPRPPPPPKRLQQLLQPLQLQLRRRLQSQRLPPQQLPSPAPGLGHHGPSGQRRAMMLSATAILSAMEPPIAAALVLLTGTILKLEINQCAPLQPLPRPRLQRLPL